MFKKTFSAGDAQNTATAWLRLRADECVRRYTSVGQVVNRFAEALRVGAAD